ncbi:MAG: NUDIX domain-containing protein, partial [Rhodomicrobium sp.]
TERGDPHILLRRRKDKGLLGGMMEAPCSEWAAGAPLASPPDGNWTEGRMVQHTFTHFHLEMRVLAAHHDEVKPAAEAFGGDWAPLANLSAFALPAVMKKAVASGLEALGLEQPGRAPKNDAAHGSTSSP